MENFITKSCSKCGEVKFKIIPQMNKIESMCVNCGQFLETITCNEFTSYIDQCGYCGHSVFKIRILDKNNVNIICSNCGRTLGFTYIDENNNIISENEREILLLKKNVLEINKRINNIEGKLEEIYLDVNKMGDIIEDETINNDDMRRNMEDVQEILSVMVRVIEELDI